MNNYNFIIIKPRTFEDRRVGHALGWFELGDNELIHILLRRDISSSWLTSFFEGRSIDEEFSNGPLLGVVYTGDSNNLILKCDNVYSIYASKDVKRDIFHFFGKYVVDELYKDE